MAILAIVLVRSLRSVALCLRDLLLVRLVCLLDLRLHLFQLNLDHIQIIF
nr:MAG TPA: hypothetical protein [Caudoviricetes sp.]